MSSSGSPTGHLESRVFRPGRLLVTILRLPLREKLTILRVLVLALLVEAGLRLVSFRRVARWFQVSLITDQTESQNDLSPPNFDETERRHIHSVLRVMRHWPFTKGSCLRQSILLAYLLRRREPVVRLGVSRQDDEIVAHAWVDICGISLGHIDGYAAMGTGPVSGSPSAQDESD